MKLDELALDALTELFNLGVGQAASAFSQIAGDTVQLTVPRVRIMTHGELSHYLGEGGTTAVSAVTQNFSGPFRTEAILMFPEDRSLEIVRMMLGESYSMDELSELEQEAMSEIGNILLNSVMASVADALHIELDGSLPTVELSQVNNVLRSQHETGGAVLMIDIQFEVAAREVKGLLAFLLDVASQDALEQLIARFVAGA